MSFGNTVFRRGTRKIITSLLGKISSVGDTCEHHIDDLDYRAFLEIQLELVKRIIETEKRISELSNESPSDIKKIEEVKERRRLLKLLGTTVAWILLQFDRPYIRIFNRGSNPGYIHGKKGLKLEILALEAAFKVENHAAVLHDITNCLQVGDLSIIGPEGIRTLELKLVKNRRKIDRREIRQKRKGKILREFYDERVSTKVLPGYTNVKLTSKKHDKHNFNELAEVIGDAINYDFGIQVVEECLIYCAYKDKINDEKFTNCIRTFKDPDFVSGCLDRHINGLPKGFTCPPFTCFEMPLLYKEKLVFGDINFCVMLDINTLCQIVRDNGFNCKKMKFSDGWVFEISIPEGKQGPFLVGVGLAYRLLYECLSVETFLSYLKEDKFKEGLL